MISLAPISNRPLAKFLKRFKVCIIVNFERDENPVFPRLDMPSDDIAFAVICGIAKIDTVSAKSLGLDMAPATLIYRCKDEAGSRAAHRDAIARIQAESYVVVCGDAGFHTTALLTAAEIQKTDGDDLLSFDVALQREYEFIYPYCHHLRYRSYMRSDRPEVAYFPSALGGLLFSRRAIEIHIDDLSILPSRAMWHGLFLLKIIASEGALKSVPILIGWRSAASKSNPDGMWADDLRGRNALVQEFLSSCERSFDRYAGPDRPLIELLFWLRIKLSLPHSLRRDLTSRWIDVTQEFEQMLGQRLQLHCDNRDQAASVVFNVLDHVDDGGLYSLEHSEESAFLDAYSTLSFVILVRRLGQLERALSPLLSMIDAQIYRTGGGSSSTTNDVPIIVRKLKSAIATLAENQTPAQKLELSQLFSQLEEACDIQTLRIHNSVSGERKSKGEVRRLREEIGNISLRKVLITHISRRPALHGVVGHLVKIRRLLRPN